MLEEEAYAELSEKMLSDTKALEKFANRELDTAKTFRKQLQKVSDAIHNALNKLGLDLGKSAAKDIKYAQETVDAWLDGMTTAISNAQKRKEQRQQQEAKQEVKAVQKAETKTEQSNNRMFTLNDNFVTELREWYSGDRNGNKRFYIGKTSEVLTTIADQEKDIYWYGSKINEIKKKHHNMTLPVIEQVPLILESPVMVLDSRTVDGRIVMFGDVYDKSGNPVLAAVELSASNGSIDDFVLIASAYARGEKINDSRARAEALQNFINGSNVRYVTDDKKRIQSWLKRTGLQLPFGAKLGFNDVSISDSSENVNRKMSLNDAYSQAVSTGNVGEQRKLVEQAAREAGHAVRAYHGTLDARATEVDEFGWNSRKPNSKFTVFDNRKSMYWDEKGSSAFFFASNKKVSESYASPVEENDGTDKTREPYVYDVFLKMENPLVVEGKGAKWYSVPVPDSIPKRQYFNYETKQHEFSDTAKTDYIVKQAEKLGYDSVVFKDIVDYNAEDLSMLGDVYAVFNSNQIKSADPVVYDDAGNVIPLSERFNKQKNDIRFSLNDSFRTDQAIRKVLGKAVEQVHESYADIDFSSIGNDTYSKFRKVIPELRKFVNDEVTEASAEKLNNTLVSVMDDVQEGC